MSACLERAISGQGVIERRADGKFDRNQSRLKDLAHLRSPRAAVGTISCSSKIHRSQDAASAVNELIGAMCGTVLTHLGGKRARLRAASI
jgi:hypothetical protein